MAKQPINTLEDLQQFIAGLSPEQKQQTPKVIDMSSRVGIYEAEITEEPFLSNPENGDCGYPSELRRRLRDWEIKKFKELEPVGQVIFYTR